MKKGLIRKGVKHKIISIFDYAKYYIIIIIKYKYNYYIIK